MGSVDSSNPGPCARVNLNPTPPSHEYLAYYSANASNVHVKSNSIVLPASRKRGAPPPSKPRAGPGAGALYEYDDQFKSWYSVCTTGTFYGKQRAYRIAIYLRAKREVRTLRASPVLPPGAPWVKG